jgi:hypothetical protein
MTVELRTYHRYVNYWNNYNDIVKLEMVQAIQKAATWAWVDFSRTIKLYAIYLKDGEKVYTDFAGFKRLLKSGRKYNIEFFIKD